MRLKKGLVRIAEAFLLLTLGLGSSLSALAATTADVTVTATPSYISISCSPTSQDFGVVSASGTPSTDTDAFTVTNTSSIATNVSIGVTTDTWSGGVGWTHSDTATAGANTVGLKANVSGTWGVSDIIVKYDTPNNLVASQAATTDFSFGLKLYAPTSFTDSAEKTVIVRLTASAA